VFDFELCAEIGGFCIPLPFIALLAPFIVAGTAAFFTPSL
jgi:hypothetical protein